MCWCPRKTSLAGAAILFAVSMVGAKLIMAAGKTCRWPEYGVVWPRCIKFPYAPSVEISFLCVELNDPQRLTTSYDLLNGINATSSTSRRRRRRRETTPDKMYIETAVFADYMLYKALVGKTLLHDHDAFVKYVLAIVNTVGTKFSIIKSIFPLVSLAPPGPTDLQWGIPRSLRADRPSPLGDSPKWKLTLLLGGSGQVPVGLL